MSHFYTVLVSLANTGVRFVRLVHTPIWLLMILGFGRT
jgi:hypothetical protein